MEVEVNEKITHTLEWKCPRCERLNKPTANDRNEKDRIEKDGMDCWACSYRITRNKKGKWQGDLI